MTWVRTVRAAELGETAAIRVEHEGRALCLARADGQPRAIEDQCPHRQAALSGGIIRNGTVTCPGHFRRFDLRTGQCPGYPHEPVRAYACMVVDGWIYVDLADPGPRRSIREILLAHREYQ